MDPRIANAFDSGALLRPRPEQPDLVHLARAIATLAGAERFAATPPVTHVLDCIGRPQHVVFVLLDGLGMNLVERLPKTAFLRDNLRTILRATSPSTTACALTSIATGMWPSEHGITGWYTHLPERHLTVTTLHMVERFSGEPLAQRGISVQELLPLPSFHSELRAAPLTLLPESIADTPFARYSRGDTAFSPYQNLSQAFERVLDFVSHASEATYTHLYFPDVDTVCHHYGLNDSRVMPLLVELDNQLRQLSRALPNDAKLVITADHGLTEVSKEAHLPLCGDDAIMALLEAPPSGDGRMPIFHVRSGSELDFSQAFNAQFGEGFALLNIKEAEQMGLFGPEQMSNTARERFGDFVGIALAPVILHYASQRSPAPQHFYFAQHAGLTPDELLIPLVVA